MRITNFFNGKGRVLSESTLRVSTEKGKVLRLRILPESLLTRRHLDKTEPDDHKVSFPPKTPHFFLNPFASVRNVALLSSCGASVIAVDND